VAKSTEGGAEVVLMTAAMLMAGFMAGTEPWWPGVLRVVRRRCL